MSEVVKLESKTTFKYDGVSGLNSAIESRNLSNNGIQFDGDQMNLNAPSGFKL